MEITGYTDEALTATINNTPRALRGYIRSAQILLTHLSDPADRAEAAARQIGLMNRLNIRGSDAMYQAVMQVKDGAPRFVDEFHPNGPTA